MKRCLGCNRPAHEAELIGGYCGRCDKIVGDISLERAIELRGW